MTRQVSTVVLMCGLPGAGQTTYAMELVHFKADRTTLERLLEVRSGVEAANAVTVDETLFNRYQANFEEPNGEGEQVVRQSST